MLPIVCSLTSVGTIVRGLSQVLPPSLVRLNKAGPVNRPSHGVAELVGPDRTDRLASMPRSTAARAATAGQGGKMSWSWSHTAYAQPARLGSAVTDSLSSVGLNVSG